MGVRPVNDITAHVTAQVTAEMDPEGMGAHMGREERFVPLEMEEVSRRDFMALMNSNMEKFTKEFDAKQEAREKALQLEFEELRKESENFKKERKEFEVREEARNQEVEAKEEARQLEFEELKKESENFKKASEASQVAFKKESEDFKKESEARQEAFKKESEAREEAFKKDISDLKKLVKSSQKRPAAGPAKAPGAKKSRQARLACIVCNDGVFALRMWINGVVVEQGGFSTLEEAQVALHLHVNGSRHIGDMLGRK